MSDNTQLSYRNWTISIARENNMCSHFSFDITDSSGNTQHVGMGGDNAERAIERAKEMIDLERSVSEYDST